METVETMALAENLFSSLKPELVHLCRFSTQAKASLSLFYWIEVWYNRKHRYSSLRYLNLGAFKLKYQQQQMLA